MRVRRLGAAASALALAGCGGSGAARPPDPSRVPLVGGTSVVAQASQCDKGANAYCSVTLVVVAPRYSSSDALMQSERGRLRALGWSLTNGDTGNEHAANSPGHKLRLTYATADGDLRGIVLGWIDRPRVITLALSRALFTRSPALSLMLEQGSG